MNFLNPAAPDSCEVRFTCSTDGGNIFSPPVDPSDGLLDDDEKCPAVTASEPGQVFLSLDRHARLPGTICRQHLSGNWNRDFNQRADSNVPAGNRARIDSQPGFKRPGSPALQSACSRQCQPEALRCHRQTGQHSGRRLPSGGFVFLLTTHFSLLTRSRCLLLPAAVARLHCVTEAGETELKSHETGSGARVSSPVRSLAIRALVAAWRVQILCWASCLSPTVLYAQT